MIVGACQLRLRLPAAQSLKDKRQVVKSVLERMRSRFGIAAAEVESNDLWQIADLGFACVSNNEGHAEDILRNVVRYVEETRPDVEIVDVMIDVRTVP